MNSFQTSYNQRLTEWRQLRELSSTIPLSEACVEIDSWWQQAPFINHHLHWLDQENWPDPWTMLSENTYCSLTRALGMCYTLLLSRSDINDRIELAHAKDCQSEEHYLVVVDDAKYVLNFWPNSVLSTTLKDFTILSSKQLESIKNKIK
jgi:hypothetical protein